MVLKMTKISLELQPGQFEGVRKKKDLTNEGIVGKSGLGSCILINTQTL